jgi:hypothetical protein
MCMWRVGGKDKNGVALLLWASAWRERALAVVSEALVM